MQFLGLTLFLELRLAFFVTWNSISFLGAFVLMQFADQSFNMLSICLILVLGIVVDDAVVVGESIFQRLRKGERPEWAAYNGTTQVFWPVVASVSTTIVAFVPLYFVDGMMGKFFAVVPFVVIAALLLSLVESIIILPGHIAHHVKPIKKQNFFTRLLAKIQRLVQGNRSFYSKDLSQNSTLSSQVPLCCCDECFLTSNCIPGHDCGTG